MFVTLCSTLPCIPFEVVLEEQTGQGPQDTQPMSLYDLITLLEKRNIVDFTITGHKVERPASVCRGEAKDTFQVTHDAYSVYKPNAVQLKAVKAGNLAGVIGTKSLSSSKYISMVWRILVLESTCSLSMCSIVDMFSQEYII